MVTLENWIEADQRNYRVKQYSSPHGAVGIKDALEKGVTGIIREVSEDTKSDVFYMLCFCLAVPQSKAVKAEEAIGVLRNHQFFQKPMPTKQIIEMLTSRVRFQNRKSAYIAAARTIFLGDFWPWLVNLFQTYSSTIAAEQRFKLLCDARVHLIKTFKGMGMKEASHFLRNVGMSGLAILDVHILKGLQRRCLIADGKISLTNSLYRDIEGVMRSYAQQVGIALDELDLLLWSQRTGFVFK